MKMILFAMLFLSQMSVFAYRIVDPDPAQEVVDFSAKQLEGKFPGVSRDDDNTTVKSTGSFGNGSFMFEVSMPFKFQDRSGVQVMSIIYQPTSAPDTYTWRIVWSDGTQEKFR